MHVPSTFPQFPPKLDSTQLLEICTIKKNYWRLQYLRASHLLSGNPISTLNSTSNHPNLILNQPMLNACVTLTCPFRTY